LDTLLEHSKVDVGDYRDALWKDFGYNNDQWGVPYARSTPLFYYNKGHFKKAGLPDRAPKTWMEFANWAKKIKQAGVGVGNHVFEFPEPSDAATWYTVNLIWGWGGGFTNKFHFTASSPETIAAYKWARDAIFKDKWARMAPKDMAADFGSGSVSAIVASSGVLDGILESAKGKFQVGTGFLPGGPKKTDDVCPTGGSGLFIPRDIEPEEQLAAMNFIKFVTSPDKCIEFCDATGYLPYRKSAKTKELTSDTPQIESAIKQLSHARPEGYIDFIPGGTKVVADAQVELFRDKNADPARVLKKADRELEKKYKQDVKPKL
jgi:sn-glycerol 3-phosphate transport system substrate-binding protein